MFVFCPICQTKLTIDMKYLDDDTAIVCVGCRSVLKAKLTVEVLAESKKTPPSIKSAPVSNDAASAEGVNTKKILIAIDGEATRDLIKEILLESQFSVVDASSAGEALSLLKQHRPATALIDVGLSDVLGTELCSSIKKDPHLKETIVILVASMYDKNTRYRREPSSLFGADDYIERHNVQKDLLLKVKKSLNQKKEAKAGMPVAPSRAETLETSKEKSSPSWQVSTDPPGKIDLRKRLDPSPAAMAAPMPEPAQEQQEDWKEHENAKRLARIIVSDIVLYNKKKVDEGLRNNTFFEVLKEEIEEGRKHYISRISAELHRKRDYYKEAFEDFIKRRKASAS